MSSAKHIAVVVFVSTVASVAVAHADTASLSVVVNRETQLVQTPTLPGAAGISYAGGSPSPLKVYTDGFLFCSNVSPGQIQSSPAYLAPAHEDQSFTPAHPWAFTTATDVLSVNYDGSSVSVNRNAQSTLACHGTHVDGSIASNSSEGIFDNGLESNTTTNYNHLINWAPATAIDWPNADWSQVPANPCVSTVAQPASLIESAACAAVTGVRPPAATPVRSATMWTATDGINFTYMFRVDVRFGAQLPQAIEQMKLPTFATSSPDSASGTTFKIIDAYDSTYLSPQGSYCYLATLPAALDSTACPIAISTQLTGTLNSPTISVNPPPVGSGSSSFYVVVNRKIGQGSHPSLTSPAVAVSILVDPALVAEGGDAFIGDDVVFGFLPGGANPSGFPWMYGQ